MKRFRTRCRLVVVGFLVVLALCTTAGAKTVVILDIKLDGMGEETEDGYLSNLETSYRAHVLNCLADLSWKNLPPKNRSDPPPETNQESKALEVIQTCWENMPVGHILQGWPPPSQLVLEYGEPRNVGGESSIWRGLVETCGDAVFTIDQMMFLDSFEMGDTSSWSSAN